MAISLKKHKQVLIPNSRLFIIALLACLLTISFYKNDRLDKINPENDSRFLFHDIANKIKELIVSDFKIPKKLSKYKSIASLNSNSLNGKNYLIEFDSQKILKLLKSSKEFKSNDLINNNFNNLFLSVTNLKNENCNKNHIINGNFDKNKNFKNKKRNIKINYLTINADRCVDFISKNLLASNNNKCIRTMLLSIVFENTYYFSINLINAEPPYDYINVDNCIKDNKIKFTIDHIFSEPYKPQIEKSLNNLSKKVELKYFDELKREFRHEGISTRYKEDSKSSQKLFFSSTHLTDFATFISKSEEETFTVKLQKLIDFSKFKIESSNYFIYIVGTVVILNIIYNLICSIRLCMLKCDRNKYINRLKIELIQVYNPFKDMSNYTDDNHITYNNETLNEENKSEEINLNNYIKQLNGIADAKSNKPKFNDNEVLTQSQKTITNTKHYFDPKYNRKVNNESKNDIMANEMLKQNNKKTNFETQMKRKMMNNFMTNSSTNPLRLTKQTTEASMPQIVNTIKLVPLKVGNRIISNNNILDLYNPKIYFEEIDKYNKCFKNIQVTNLNTRPALAGYPIEEQGFKNIKGEDIIYIDSKNNLLQKTKANDNVFKENNVNNQSILNLKENLQKAKKDFNIPLSKLGKEGTHYDFKNVEENLDHYKGMNTSVIKVTRIENNELDMQNNLEDAVYFEEILFENLNQGLYLGKGLAIRKIKEKIEHLEKELQSNCLEKDMKQIKEMNNDFENKDNKYNAKHRINTLETKYVIRGEHNSFNQSCSESEISNDEEIVDKEQYLNQLKEMKIKLESEYLDAISKRQKLKNVIIKNKHFQKKLVEEKNKNPEDKNKYLEERINIIKGINSLNNNAEVNCLPIGISKLIDEDSEDEERGKYPAMQKFETFVMQNYGYYKHLKDSPLTDKFIKKRERRLKQYFAKLTLSNWNYFKQSVKQRCLIANMYCRTSIINPFYKRTAGNLAYIGLVFAGCCATLVKFPQLIIVYNNEFTNIHYKTVNILLIFVFAICTTIVANLILYILCFLFNLDTHTLWWLMQYIVDDNHDGLLKEL